MKTKERPFIERDISWLHFNDRVLQEAKDQSVPLYERIKFLAIFSSNLDEFFRVRVASLRSFRKLDKSTRKEMELRPRRLLRQIRQMVERQQSEFGRIYREEILPDLARHKIFLVNEKQFTKEQKVFTRKLFKEKITPLLHPVFLEKEAPFLENKALYFLLHITQPKERLGLVKLPTDELGRFVVLPSDSAGHYVAFLDDVVRIGLSRLFPKQKLSGAYAVKLSRDAELYIDDEFSGDLLEKIKQGLEERHVGLPTRLLFDSSMPTQVLSKMKGLFQLTKNDLIPGARYHNFNDFFGFPNPAGLQELHDKPMPPLPHPKLDSVPSLLKAMAEKDFLIHFPYQKFDYVERFIQESAENPEVESFKITLYRVTSKSPICEGLLKALEAGKKVTVFIEAKARFDEATNLFWGERLEKAGATVRYSFPGIKVHTKLLLITKKDGSHFAYLATGNFNEKTALLYADHALFTADPRLAEDAARVFDLLEGKAILPKTKNLLTAPFTLRTGFEKLIDKEIKNAGKGEEAWMIVKINSLEDKRMAEKLIEASQAGVKIRMIVRGICCLEPGVKGFTENVEIISILDRFLEHARVFIFANSGEEKMYLASADWMGRNLDHRVEVAFPVFDEELRKEIRRIIDIQLSDNVKARRIDGLGGNKYKKRKNGELEVRAQVATYELLKGKLA